MRNLFVIIWVLLLFPLQKSWGQSGGYYDYGVQKSEPKLPNGTICKMSFK